MKEETRRRIGQELAEIRKSQHLTQQDIADMTGLQRSNVARVEQGRYRTVSTVADTNWRRFTFTFTATASTTRASIFINESSDEWTVWYTQFQLEKNVAATSWKM